jgi:hypothetical protein
MLFPGLADLILVLLDEFERCRESVAGESIVPRKFQPRLQPELGLPGWMLDVHMGTRLFTGEEVKSIATDTENRGAHRSRIADDPLGLLRGLTPGG